jgi:hypothetical protein
MPALPPAADLPAAENESQTNPLSAIEISGAICARVIHDLSNLVSGIVGNAEYAQTEGTDPDKVAKAIEAIGLSAISAGKLLGQCLPLQKLVSAECVPCDVAELALVIAEWSNLAPGWQVLEPRSLTGSVRAQPKWLSAAVWQIAREASAQGGETEFATGPAVFPLVWHGTNPNHSGPVELFQITFRYRSEQAFASGSAAVNPAGYALLAAQELIHRMKGQIHSRPKPPGRQEISILLPLL